MTIPSADDTDFLDRVRGWLVARSTRVVVSWLICLAVAGQRWHHARHEFDTDGYLPEEKRRADGNLGHTHIDFGGQWVFGRMAATGHFRQLYHRDAQWRVAIDGYPLDRQSDAIRLYADRPESRPTTLTQEDVQTDAQRLVVCFMGDRREAEVARRTAAVVGGGDHPFAAAVHWQVATAPVPPPGHDLHTPLLGGPLYPPVHALLYAPLGTLDAQPAYFLFQWVLIGAAFLSGFAVRVISGGRVWWPVATAVILLYPGGRPGLDLAQNNLLTLAIIAGGWALAVRGREFAGGAVWGLLAFKPVWGVAFILVPVLMRRWRFVAGTAACGLSLVAATLPFVGVQGWQDWLEVGKEASAKYNVNSNWINLSRDVSGIPRRLLIDFKLDENDRDTPTAKWASNACLAVVVVGTAAVYLWRGDRRKLTGLSAGFLTLSGYLSCYRFMYYDATLSVLGFAVLLANPAWTFRGGSAGLVRADSPPTARRVRLFVNSFPLIILVALLVNDNMVIGTTPQATVAVGRWQRTVTDADGTEKTVTPQVTMAGDYNHPVDTLLILAVWAWCGWRLIRDGRAADDESVQAGFPSSASSADPMSGDRINDSPTNTA